MDRGIKELPIFQKSIVDVIGVGGGSNFKSLGHGSIYASDAAFCARKCALHTATPKDIYTYTTPATMLYMAVGTAIHEVIDELLSPVSLATELSMDFFGIRGRIDNIVWDGDGLKIIDTKTCGKLPVRIKPQQKEQLACYSLMTGVRRCSILYVSRSIADWNGNVKIKEIPLILDDDDIYHYATTIAASVYCSDHNIIPMMPQPGRREEKDCGFCPFIPKCYHGEELFETNWKNIYEFDDDDIRYIRELRELILDGMNDRYNILLDKIREEERPLTKHLLEEGLLVKR